MSYSNTEKPLPSCFDLAKIEKNSTPSSQKRTLIVAIDGTFGPDNNLKRNVHNKVHNFIRPGDEISIISFSAYVNGNYTKIQFSGTLDTPVENRHSISKTKLSKFDNCIKRQQEYFRKKINIGLKSSFKTDKTEIPNTEIVNNLSNSIAPIVREISSDKKILVLVSDMLENSDITSFYQSGKIKLINPKLELEKITSANMISDLNNTDVYVIGAGWNENNDFKGGQAMQNIKSFWNLYFLKSNAKLLEYGQPILLGNIQ